MLLVAGCTEDAPTYSSDCALVVTSRPVPGMAVRVNGAACTTAAVLRLPSYTRVELDADDKTCWDTASEEPLCDVRLCFRSWADGDTGGRRTITLKTDTIVEMLVEVQYLVRISSHPPEVHGGDSLLWVEADSLLIIRPRVSGEYRFSGWRLDSTWIGSNTDLRVRVRSPHTIIACYRRQRLLRLMSYPDTGMEVFVDGNPHHTPAEMLFEPGDSVTLSVPVTQEFDRCSHVPQTDARYSFVQWNGVGPTPVTKVIMEDDVTMSFLARPSYRVSMNVEPEGVGVLAISDTGDSNWYAAQTRLVVTAPYAPPHALEYWEVNGAPQYAGAGSCTLTVDRPMRVRAVFRTPSPGEPCVYRAYMTSLSYVQGTPAALRSEVLPLPDLLILPPGQYEYHGYVYDLNREGLYRFLDDSTQQRFVYRNDLDALMSAMSWTVYPVPGTIDLELSENEWCEKAMWSKLNIWCDAASRWAAWVLWAHAPVRYWGLQHGATHHAVIEAWHSRHGKWVLYDITLNAFFVGGDAAPLSLKELVTAIETGEEYDVALLADDIGMDMDSDVQVDHATTESFVRAFCDQLMRLPLVVNGSPANTVEELNALLGQ